MNSTLSELDALTTQWTALRAQRPGESDFTPWGYPGAKAEDIDALLSSWKEAIELASAKTRSVSEPQEKIIDLAVAKLLREARQHVAGASSNGVGWLVQSTPFMTQLADVASHLAATLTGRVEIRKALLKVASSNLNDQILSVAQAAPVAEKIIVEHKEITQKRGAIDEAAKVAQTANADFLTARQSLEESQKQIAQLLADANQGATNIQNQATQVSALTTSAQQTLDEISSQKAAADKQIAASTELLGKANEQITKALQDINRQGLAGAFSAQSGNIAVERFLWVIAFGLSIIWLVGVATYMVWMPTQVAPGSFDWPKLLQGLPLAAPAIWFGWFSARQVAMLARIQQDYAYKASTAVAFEGYKKEVTSANDEALSKQLLEAAIRNFGENPVRLYGTGKDDHAHPIEALIEKVKDEGTRNFIVEIFKTLKPEAKR